MTSSKNQLTKIHLLYSISLIIIAYFIGKYEYQLNHNKMNYIIFHFLVTLCINIIYYYLLKRISTKTYIPPILTLTVGFILVGIGIGTILILIFREVYPILYFHTEVKIYILTCIQVIIAIWSGKKYILKK